jgi:hypothetical protein
MRNGLRLVAISVVLLFGTGSQSPPESALTQIYDQHRWFDLRDAIAGRTVSPRRRRGCVQSHAGR